MIQFPSGVQLKSFPESRQRTARSKLWSPADTQSVAREDTRETKLCCLESWQLWEGIIKLLIITWMIIWRNHFACYRGCSFRSNWPLFFWSITKQSLNFIRGMCKIAEELNTPQEMSLFQQKQNTYPLLSENHFSRINFPAVLQQPHHSHTSLFRYTLSTYHLLLFLVIFSFRT